MVVVDVVDADSQMRVVPGRVWAGLGWAGIRDRTGMYMANKYVLYFKLS